MEPCALESPPSRSVCARPVSPWISTPSAIEAPRPGIQLKRLTGPWRVGSSFCTEV